jgi:hypothetical protein
MDQIDVTNLDLPVHRLPASFEGLTACQLSDLHVDSETDLLRVEKALTIIQATRPDMVFLTGDYFSTHKSMKRYIGALQRLLAQLKTPLGVFAITGNHDHNASFWSIARALTNSGVRLLENENRRIEIEHRQVAIVGIGDLWSQRARPSRAFQGIRPDDCTIVLVHNPDTAIYLRHLRPGIVLSGHTHGGIIRLPIYGPALRSFLKIGREFYSGLNRYRDFYIYTNRGLGTFPLGVRVNCRPEVSIFTLRTAGDAPGALL